MENVRIDKGMKRSYRQQARTKPLVRTRTYNAPHDPKVREALLKSLPEEIIKGRTVREVAEQHGIPVSTLKSWVLGDTAVENARGVVIDSELTLRMEAIDVADDPLALARAREGFRAWAWIAERREARLYGQQTSVKVEHTVDLGDRLRRARDRVGRVLEHGEDQDVQDAAALPVAVPSEPGQS